MAAWWDMLAAYGANNGYWNMKGPLPDKGN
jgi:hypothetical protein